MKRSSCQYETMYQFVHHYLALFYVLEAAGRRSIIASRVFSLYSIFDG